MINLKLKTYKLKTGHHVVCFINPISKRRVRKKFKSKADANNHKKELEQKFANKGKHAFDITPVAKLMQMHLEDRPDSKVTERKNSFISFCNHFGHFKISEIGKLELEYWFNKIKKENNYSDRTLKHIKSQLNHFFKYLIDKDIIKYSPMNDLKFASNPLMKKPRVVLSMDEVKCLLQNAKQFNERYFYPYLFTIANTGARKAEIMNLKRDNIDFQTGFINLYKTKNGENRSIKMSNPLRELLQKHLESHSNEYAFIGSQGRKFGSSQLQRWIKKLKHQFPMQKNWGLHSLRHSFAFNFLKKGGQMYQLQAILGHKTIGMTVDLYGQLRACDIENVSPYDDLLS